VLVVFRDQPLQYYRELLYLVSGLLELLGAVFDIGLRSLQTNLPCYYLFSDFAVLHVGKFGDRGSQLMFVLDGRTERGRQFRGHEFGGTY
jgi:hypothetical protein